MSTFNVQDHLETRTYTTKDGVEHQFKFLVINNEERWREASEARGHFNMPLLGQGRSLRFQLCGISVKEWSDIELRHVIPQWSEENKKPSDEYIANRELAIAAKRANVIEVSSGKTIPGEDYIAKAKSLQSLNNGEVHSLYLYIQDVICANEDGSLMQQFRQIISEQAAQNTVEFTDFVDWQRASEYGYFFRMQRPTDDYILEFPLKDIPADAKLAIEMETRDPDPPMIPYRDPATNRFVPNQMVPDHNDKNWQARCRVVSQKRLAMFLNACLPFQLPGENIQKQYEWVAGRLIGDVLRLQGFIENELCGYRSRFDFFTLV